MFKFQIEPWGNIRNVQIHTRHVGVTLNENDDSVEYTFREYGEIEYVEYKFKLKKRDGYKEYVKKLIEVDVAMPLLKDLTGVMSFFRDVYHNTLSMYRRGLSVDVSFKWRDGDVVVLYGISASKDLEMMGVENKLSAEFGSEYIYFRHGGAVKDVENDLERHTQRIVGLYMLFKEYVLQRKA